MYSRESLGLCVALTTMGMLHCSLMFVNLNRGDNGSVVVNVIFMIGSVIGLTWIVATQDESEVDNAESQDEDV